VNVPALFSLDMTDFYPVFDDKGSLGATSTVYPLRRFREEDSTVEETTYTPRIDLRWDFENLLGGKEGFIKFGAKYTDRTRFVDDNSSRPVNDALTIDTFGARLPGRMVWDNRYDTGILINFPKSFEYLDANRGMFTIDPLESASNSVEDDYDIDEEILALYGMASLDVSERLTILGGLRWERTDASVIGFEVREADGDFEGVFENKGEFKYDNFLPNIQFRYSVTEQVVLRGAITATIGRPAYEQAAPISVLEYEPLIMPDNPAFGNTGSLEIGNPTLSPYESVNFDLSLEYYMPSGGLLSAAIFHKEIKNAIYDYFQRLEDTTYNGIGFETLNVSSLQNSDNGKITGIEFNAQVPFTIFTTGFLGGFGVDANATFIDSEAVLNLRNSETVPFFRQPDKIYNLGLYYQMGAISARVAWNYQTESIRTIGGSAGSDIWRGDRYQFDVQASYNINESYTIFFKWKNVTDQPNELYIGDSTQLRNAEFYGSDIRAGIRFNF
jgi:TonB-dependent receptor